ncbi:rhodanese family protein [Phenylobacterium sp.]|uniref:rhodanese family protein n=1 Tax=Phenylobacterium sp. TaxID=1871053 RepID=UPI0025F9D5CA|nr:rhodanese family protein [Phenylobacterium sp.]
MTLIPIKPEAAARRLQAGKAVLVDIREADEFARRHVRGALSRPLSAFQQAHLQVAPDADVIFTCRTGMRTGANCDRLAAATQGPAYVLEGGVDAWSAEGLPVDENRKAPLEMMRQVQIAAGSLVLVGVTLGVLVHPAFLGVAAFVGAGLTFAGATGFCGMARLLAVMPWNRRAA